MDLETLTIDLKGLKQGINTFHFSLDHTYFEALEEAEVSEGNIELALEITRTANDLFTLIFRQKGTVMVPCTICLDPLPLVIDIEERLEAKFGNEYSEDDNLITIAESEGTLDVSWFVYEFIVLAIPIKHVHAPGKCNPAMIRMLEKHSTARSSEEDDKTIDPRWEALLKLKE